MSKKQIELGKKNIPVVLILFLSLSITVCEEKYHEGYRRLLNSNPSSLASSNSIPKSTNSSSQDEDSLGIFGLILGPILFMLSIIGVWFNERRAAINYRRLKLAEKYLQKQPNLIYGSLDQDNMNQFKNSNRLLHIVGHPQIIQGARDEEIDVIKQEALVLERIVEVKQMRLYKTKGRHHRPQDKCDLNWVPQNIQYINNQYNSPQPWFITPHKFYSSQTKLGSYTLCQGQLKQLQCQTQLEPSDQIINTLLNLSKGAGFKNEPKVHDNYIYFAGSDDNIQSRGSIRIKYRYCKQTDLSVICGIQEDKRMYKPFRIDLVDNKGMQDQPVCNKNKEFCCGCCSLMADLLKPMTEINLIQKGNYTSHEMFYLGVKKNTKQTYSLRLMFLVLMVIGFCIFFGPIVEAIGYFPIFGSFMKGFAGILVFFAALMICIPLFLVVFGAWIRYHPKIGGIVLGLASVSLMIVYICS